MRWKQRFDFVMDAIVKAENETGERKGHYLNVTAPIPEEMYKRAEYAREIRFEFDTVDKLDVAHK